MSVLKYRTTIVIDSDYDPGDWSLQEFYWSVENDDSEIVSSETVKKAVVSKVKPSKGKSK
jgi:hypothetical protein